MLKLISISLLAVATILPAVANAIKVDFATVDLGSNNYRYDFVIHNDGSLGIGTSVQLLDLLFDPAVYDENTLTNTSAAELATDWTQRFLGSAPLVPAAFDLSTTGPGITAGSQLEGFSVQFNWLGNGLPGTQAFEVYDPATFSLLEQGMTTPVPLPGAWSMMAGGMLLLTYFRRKRQSEGVPA